MRRWITQNPFWWENRQGECSRRVFSALAVLVMLEVIASLFILSGFTDVLVRDVAILLLAVSLFFDNARHYSLTKR